MAMSAPLLPEEKKFSRAAGKWKHYSMAGVHMFGIARGDLKTSQEATTSGSPLPPVRNTPEI
jgi:hypothetical protein